MVRQSQATILLTRPLVQSQRFAATLQDVVISPLMEPEFLYPEIPLRQFAAVILTSETGVEAARRISAKGLKLPSKAFCVGSRTAGAARAAGFDAVSADADATGLLALIIAAKPAGTLLFLRGADVAGQLQESLISAGIDTVSAVTYRQVPQPMNQKAVDLLHGTAPVILPVFSPRSSRLLAEEVARVCGSAPLWLVAISQPAAQAFDLPLAQCQIASRPDGSAMMQAITGLQQQGMT